ncbi:MAG: 3-oxoacyl-ACP reductase [Bacteroidota bacterium]
MQLTQQVVLITGAGRGLGAQIARSFAREGAKVVLNYYKSQAAAEAHVQEIGKSALAIQADVRDKAAVEKMVAQAQVHFDQPVSTVVNNALVNYKFDLGTKKDAANISWEDYQEQLEGAVKGSLNTLQACLEGMKEQQFGRVINIGTNLFQNPVVPYHDYTTSKGALLAFTRNMANELGQHGITVNMLSGGLLRTTDASAATSAEVFGIIEATTPLRRVTTPEEAADATLFFASPWARAVTGQNLVVDGGLVFN